MKHDYEVYALLSAVLLVATGCTTNMKVDDYKAWENYMSREAEALRSDIAEKTERKRQLEEEKKRKAEEKMFLISKSQVLIKENATLVETWDGMGTESHEVMMNLFSRIHDSEMAFYDVRLGNPLDENLRKMTDLPKGAEQFFETIDSRDKYTILVEMGRTIQEDCRIQMAEIYTSKKVRQGSPAKVRFVILAKEKRTGAKTEKYVIRRVSDSFTVNSEGLNRFIFANRPLEAAKGNLYGIMLEPGAAIDVVKLDTGRVARQELKSMPDDYTKVQLEIGTPSLRGEKGPGSMEMALMMRGTSLRKSMFIVDGKPFPQRKLLNSVTAKITTPDGRPLPVYFAVLERKNLASGQNIADADYELRDISEMVMVPSGETKEIPLKHFIKKDGHKTFEARKDDICALLLPGVTDPTKVKSESGFRTVAPFDYSNPRFRKRLSEMKKETAEANKALEKEFIFVSFKVE